MSPLDKNSIQSKLARIEKNVRLLQTISEIPLADYLQDTIKQLSAERLLHTTIEAMLDIGSHIVASEKLGEPLKYRDIFILLIKAQILPKNKEETLINLAGLRNRIVHLYEDIDHELLYKALKTELNDFKIYTQAILKYLKS